MSRDHRRAVRLGVVGGIGLVGLCAASGLAGPATAPIFVGAGMAAFVLCGARALDLCGTDRIVFSHRPPGRTGTRV